MADKTIVISVGEQGVTVDQPKLKVKRGKDLTFECATDNFEIDFDDGDSPLDQGARLQSNGKKLKVKVKNTNVRIDHDYKYSVTVAGHPVLDPVIVVKNTTQDP